MKRLRNWLTRWLNKQVDPKNEFPLSDFERLRHEIRPGDVLLVQGRTRVGRAIRMITHSPWTHSALYIGRVYDIEDKVMRERLLAAYPGDPNEQLIIESVMDKGIVVSPLNLYREEHIRICRAHGIARQDVQQVIYYAINKLGVQYDVRQIFDLARFLFPWGIIPRRWRSSLFTFHPSVVLKESCSSLIAEAFQSVDFPVLPVIKQAKGKGFTLVHRIPKLYTPSDFDYSPFFEIVKYPIFELAEQPMYRQLPWREGVFGDAEGKFYTPLISPETEEKIEKPSPKPPVEEFFD